jgi:hypothetical protein
LTVATSTGHRPLENAVRKCVACQHYDRNDIQAEDRSVRWGKCRRTGPIVNPLSAKAYLIEGVWPAVRDDDWCGEWTPGNRRQDAAQAEAMNSLMHSGPSSSTMQAAGSGSLMQAAGSGSLMQASAAGSLMQCAAPGPLMQAPASTALIQTASAAPRTVPPAYVAPEPVETMHPPLSTSMRGQVGPD